MKNTTFDRLGSYVCTNDVFGKNVSVNERHFSDNLIYNCHDVYNIHERIIFDMTTVASRKKSLRSKQTMAVIASDDGIKRIIEINFYCRMSKGGTDSGWLWLA